MATVIRDFLSIFGIKVEDEDLEQMDKIVNWLDGLPTRKQVPEVMSPFEAPLEPPGKPLH